MSRWPLFGRGGDRHLGFFRVLGYGVHWRNRNHHRLYFSERNWYRVAHLIVGPWHIRFLGRGRASR